MGVMEAIRFEYRCPLLRSSGSIDERGLVSVPLSIVPQGSPLVESLKKILKDSFCVHRDCRLDCEIKNIKQYVL
jgi:hypothetical protein